MSTESANVLPARLALRDRVMKAGVWSIIGFGSSTVLRFGTSLIMTRLLAPEMFGVMAIASMVMVGLIMFSEIGLRQNVVQSPRGDEPAFLNTVWSIQIIRGFSLWLIASAIGFVIFIAQKAGLVVPGSVYSSPSLPLVVIAISATAIVAGFDSTKLLEASRGLSVGSLTKLDLAGQLGGLLIMGAWLTSNRSIWVLVAGSIGSSIIRTTLSHTWLVGMSNRWQWDRAAAYEIFHFGKWLFLSSVLGFFVYNGDRLMLGGLVDASQLGLYVIAFQIYASLEQVLNKVILDVIFPALSEIARERRHDLKASYYKFHVLIASFSYFCAGSLFVTAPRIISILYDPRYVEAGTVLRILALTLLTVPFRVATECFLAMGMPQLLSTSTTIRLVSLFVALPVGLHYFGFAGAVWGIVLSNFSWVPLQLAYKVVYGLFDLRKEMLALSFIAIGVLVGKLAIAILP